MIRSATKKERETKKTLLYCALKWRQKDSIASGTELILSASWLLRSTLNSCSRAMTTYNVLSRAYQNHAPDPKARMTKETNDTHQTETTRFDNVQGVEAQIICEVRVFGDLLPEALIKSAKQKTRVLSPHTLSTAHRSKRKYDHRKRKFRKKDGGVYSFLTGEGDHPAFFFAMTMRALLPV